MTSQTGSQIIAMHILPYISRSKHILPYISRSKGNQAMKFGQLIEYNLRNIFVGKLHTKYTAETIPTPLFKIS